MRISSSSINQSLSQTSNIPPVETKKPELKLQIGFPIGDALRELGYGQDLFETAFQGEMAATNALQSAETQTEYDKAHKNWKTSRTLLNAALGIGQQARKEPLKGIQTNDPNGFPFINQCKQALANHLSSQGGFPYATVNALKREMGLLLEGVGLTHGIGSTEIGLTMDAEDNENGTQIIRSVMKVPGMNVHRIKDTDGTPLLPLVAEKKLYSAAQTYAAIPGINVNEAGPDGITALHWFAESNGNPQTIQALLDAGANPRQANPVGQTPLHWAARSGNPYNVQTLLNAGADPNQADKYKHTPLHVAVANKNSDAVQALLDTGADPNHADLKRQTPLHWAASEGNLDILRALLNANAAPNKKDHQGRTPISCACDQEAKRLLKHANPSFTQRVKKHLQPLFFLG